MHRCPRCQWPSTRPDQPRLLNLTYAGLAGAAGQVSSMAIGSGDTYAFSYDTGMRLTSASLTQVSNNTLMYQTQPAYDAANNVVSVQTSISGATDTQQFC